MTAREGHRRFVESLGEWGRRYLPLEIVSTLAALAGAGFASLVVASPLAVAYAGAWAENVGYYGYAFAREMKWIWRSDPSRTSEDGSVGGRMLAVLKALVWEFGAAEVLDSFVVRPLAIYAAVSALGSVGLGVIAGKLAADAVFYGIAIVFYELGKAPAKRRA